MSAALLPSLLLVGTLAAEPAGPPVPSAPPPEQYTLRADRNLVLPAVEGIALNWVINTFGRHVLQAEFAQVTDQTILRNFQGGWRLDTDDIWINFVGHPYQGSLAFNAARSSGLSFWESMPWAGINSVLWEIAGEAEPPSINDLVITSTSGAIVGEALHRLSALLWDRPTGSGFRDVVLGVLLDPLGGFNRGVFGRPRRRSELAEPPPYELSFGLAMQHARAGALREPLTQLVAAVELLYGMQPRATPDASAPLSLFRFRAELGGHGPLHGLLRLEGLLAGASFETPTASGAWGLFSSHDFSTGAGFRTAGSGVGPGALVSWPVGDEGELRAFAIASWVMLGAAGTFEDTDNLTRASELGPAYALGTGISSLAEVSLAGPLGEARLFGDAVQLFPSSGHPLTGAYRVGLGGHLAVGSGHGVGAELLLDRIETLGVVERPSGYTGRVYWRYDLDRS